MTERSYQDAVQVLNGRMGARWGGLEAEGRDEMVRVLKEQLGYDDRQANDALDAMVATGAIHYHTAGAGARVVVPAPPSSGGGLVSGVPPAGIPVAGVEQATGEDDGGYWQIGEGVVESSERKGQVQPT
jgi:hypothetical protein